MIAYDIKTAARDLILPAQDTFWSRRQSELVAHLLTTDANQFLTWPEIVGTMFVGDAEIAGIEYAALQSDSQWETWREIIKESDYGSPARLPYADYTSGNLIHQAYHIMRWQNATKRRIADLDRIVEIGGGYGALALLVRRMGFAGRYTIIDLPAFALLQRYYLAQFGLSAEWTTHGAGLSADLVVGLWSLSEMSPADQYAALDGLDAGGYLVAGCGDLNIGSIEQHSRRETIEHLPPNSYWLA